MIKTLHITSIIVVVLAAGLFVFPVVFGFRGDAEIEKFLTAPSVLDKFRKAASKNARTNENESSPLVARATSFALILNPPPKKIVKKDPKPEPVESIHPKPPPEHIPSAKFKVVATSYNQSRPEESLALIDEPGKGLHWVRQADVVGNLTIEVQNGSVLAKAGNKTETLTVPHKPHMSLIAGESQIPAAIGIPTVTPTRQPPKRGNSKDKNTPRIGKTGNTGSQATASSAISEAISEADIATIEEQKEMAEKIFAELEAMGSPTTNKTNSAKGNEGRSAVAGDASKTSGEETGITDTEASKIGDLGRELENLSPRERAKRARDKRAAERSKKLQERIERARRTRE